MKHLPFIFLFVVFSSFGTSPCEYLGQSVLSCEKKSLFKRIGGQLRYLEYATPKLAAPTNGYPTVIFFQGSFFPVRFRRTSSDLFGGFHELKLIKNLLDQGYAVIAPRAIGNLFWQTNIPGVSYEFSNDRKFVNEIFNMIEEGRFGNLDPSSIFATGVSSGGYMSDRLVQSHSQVNIKAIAIASASYADCSGSRCSVPERLARSVPSLFLHGKKDLIVPLRTMEKYFEFLDENGVSVKKVLDSEAGHEWLPSSPKEVVDWFNSWR